MYCANNQVMPESSSRVEEVVIKADRNLIPLHAMLELTYRCNVDCVHCYCQHLADPVVRPELTTAQWLRVVDELAELGSLYLTFTGGEIFMRPDFLEIAFHAKKRHFAITLFTNGTMITEKIADRVWELRPLSIEMSLLHSEEEKHDLLAKKKGSYRKILRAAALLKERGLPFVLKTSILKQNADQVREIYEIGKTAGACRVSFSPILSPRNDGNLSPLASAPTREQLKNYFLMDIPLKWKILEEIPLEAARSFGTCGAATTSINVNPYGDILPCNQLLIPFGNVREQPLRQAWENPPPALAEVRRRQTYGSLPECRDCELISFCKRCHGLALLETGKWDAKYKQACDLAALVKETNDHYKKQGEEKILEKEGTYASL